MAQAWPGQETTEWPGQEVAPHDENWPALVTTGLQRGVSSIIGAPRDLTDLLGKTATAAGVSPSDWNNAKKAAMAVGMPILGLPDELNKLPSSADVDQAWSKLGPQYDAQTLPGKIAQGVIEFAPAALGGEGGAAVRAGRMLTSAAGSYAGRKAAQAVGGGDLAQQWGSLVGGGVGAAAPEGLTALDNAANVARAARQAPLKDAQALAQEFGPLTAGEQSGDSGQKLQEDDWRRNLGGDAAQTVMRNFDARRAQQIRDNIFQIATRGLPPLTENIEDAGITLADALRDMRQNHYDLASQQYKTAFDLAQNEPVPTTAQPIGDIVAAQAKSKLYQVPGPVSASLSDLQDAIQNGAATQGLVERARQQISRGRSTAMNARDDASEFVHNDIIGALDQWQAGLLRNPAAVRAMNQARAIFGEGQQLFTPQGRIDLSTGQQGRIDVGGRAIDKVVNTDLTGQQIIDSFLGAGAKPSQQSLGAVARIRQLGTRTIKYSAPNAPSGVRAPGRISLGPADPMQLDNRVAGSKAFAADDPNAPGGVQQPAPILQALREGLLHKVLAPLDAYIQAVQTGGADQGGLLPSQTLYKSVQSAASGAQNPLVKLLFTPAEQAKLARAAQFTQRLVPPPGIAASGTPSGIGRMIGHGVGHMVNHIPVVGPVLSIARGIGEDAMSAGAARAATTQRPLPTIRAQRAVRPSPASYLLASVGGSRRIAP